MWPFGSQRLIRIEVETGTPTYFDLPVGLPRDQFYGGAWTLGNGNPVFYYNPGQMVQLNIDNPGSPNPDISVVSVVPGEPAAGGSDATTCDIAPADLRIDKTAATTLNPDGTLNWTIRVTNVGTTSSTGWTVTDPLPPGVTATSATSADAVCTLAAAGASVTCAGKHLTPGSSAEMQLTTNPPSPFTDCITNRANVVGNETDPNPDNDSATAIRCPDLALQPDYETTPVNTPVTVDVLANDGQVLENVSALDLLDGAGVPVTTLSVPEGRFEVVDQKVVFTPAPKYTGTVPAVTYQVTLVDGQVATTTVVIKVTPTASPDSTVTPLNTPITIDVLGDDGLDPAHVSSVSLVDERGEAVSTLTITEGTFDVVGKQITFTPARDYVGTTPEVPYRVTMDDDQTTESTIQVTVTPVDTTTTTVDTTTTTAAETTTTTTTESTTTTDGGTTTEPPAEQPPTENPGTPGTTPGSGVQSGRPLARTGSDTSGLARLALLLLAAGTGLVIVGRRRTQA